MSSETAPASPGDVWQEATRLTRLKVLFDVAAASLFLLIAGLLQARTSSAMVWATVALAVGFALRRVSVALMLLAALVATVVQLVSGDVAVIGNIAFAPLAFVLGEHPSRTVRRVGFVAVTLAIAGAGLWSAFVGTNQLERSGYAGVGMTAITAVVVGGGYAAGFVRWQGRRAVQAQVEVAFAAAERHRVEVLYRQEQERNRIAADMHDLVAHSWAIVAAQADGARYVLRDDPARAEEALNLIGETARSAMNDVRGLLAELRDGAPTTPVEAPVIDSVIARMRATGLVIEHARHGAPAAGAAAEAAGFVLTESLTNALKHGDRTHPVEVVEDWRDGCVIRVANTVPPGAAVSGSGHGLRGMTERVASVSASSQGRHWLVEVRIPAGAR
ncbi:signal transduction histidine kinase [Marmoricola sp. OAE513]|uniref:sensor histidine kinase n=1 Tax=Marmoricola sp. OAE513 TaxID=2817894 RepID=UPI001AE7D82D